MKVWLARRSRPNPWFPSEISRETVRERERERVCLACQLGAFDSSWVDKSPSPWKLMSPLDKILQIPTALSLRYKVFPSLNSKIGLEVELETAFTSALYTHTYRSPAKPPIPHLGLIEILLLFHVNIWWSSRFESFSVFFHFFFS